ncbi:Nepenthesin [Bertholletia excelsa]
MDTGSSFIWFQCLPCNCFHHVNPIFDPSKSSTYRHIYCDQHRHIICEYSHTYSDHTTTIGTLAREDLTLVTSDQGTTTIQDVVVGCGHNNSGTLDPLASGILGLGGNDKSSLLYHIGGRNPKFSYCIGNLSDPYYEYNHLIIGDGAIIQGYSTPIQVVNGLYYLTLQGISLGEMSLPINPNIFKRAPLSGHSGVIIDSGTTLIYLHRLGFEALKAQVRSLIGGLLQQVTSQNYPDWFCYRGDSIKQQLREFPALTFHFEGGADLVLESDAMFTKASVGVFCLSVVPSDNPYPNLSIIGIKAQQYYNMAYDLDAMKLYFQRIDCELLED